MVKPKIFIKLPQMIAEIKEYITTHPRISARKKNAAMKSPLIKQS